MKLHNPFVIADEPNTFLLKLSLSFIVGSVFIGLIMFLLTKPLVFGSVLCVLMLLRVIFAIFKGK